MILVGQRIKYFLDFVVVCVFVNAQDVVGICHLISRTEMSSDCSVQLTTKCTNEHIECWL